MIGRQAQILEYVTGQERANVPELAQLCDVSQVTIRKDLDSLEQLGLIRRQHGVALAPSPDDIRGRLAIDYELKHAIARRAVDLVADGETVFIESGSCCALLASEIATGRHGCTIITNSAFIAERTRGLHGASVVLLGGDYQPEAQVVVGPLAEQNAASFFADRLFIGIDGLDPASGFTARDQSRAAVVRAMARQVRDVVVVTTSAKFRDHGAVHLLPLGDVRDVITDDQAPRATQELLAAAGIDVTLVEGSHESVDSRTADRPVNRTDPDNPGSAGSSVAHGRTKK